MNGAWPVHLVTATALAAALCAPAHAQGERAGRLPPPAAVAAPVVVDAPPAAMVPPAPLPLTAAVDPVPAATVSGAAGSAASTAALPAARPALAAGTPTVLPGAASEALSSPAASGPTPLPNTTSKTAAPPLVGLRVRAPRPAVRVAAAVAAVEDTALAAEVVATVQEAVVEAEDAAATAGAVPSTTTETVAAEAVTAPAVPAAVSLDDMARAADAMRSAAEQERAAVTAQQPQPRPAPHAALPAEAAATAAPVEAVPVEADAPVEAVPVADPAAPHGVAPAAPAPEAVAEIVPAAAADHGDEPHPTDAPSPPAAAAASTSIAPAPASPAPEPAQATEHASADGAVTGPEPANAAAVVAAGADTGEADERRGGVRWIAGAGLPPPATEPPVAQSADAEPAGGDRHPDAHASPADAEAGAAADGHGTDTAAAPAPRTRRRPSTAPIAAPYQLVRTLQAMQDDMAGGSTAALAGQRTLLQRMEEEFADADPLVWQDRRNARALVAYTLGGGRPVTLRRLLASETPPDGDAALMRGALAYVEGDEATARKYLTDIDAKSLPASLGGQLALAQAALVVGEDSKRSLELLDTARLLAPGTLVEEAALRRQIFVASELNDLARFEMLSSQYLRRFRRSVYAGNFRRRFAAALSRMDFLDDPAQFHRLDDMLAETDPEARRELYLVVAQAAVNEGKTGLAATSAERALASAPPGSLDEARGRLYRGAALAVTHDGLDAAMADLRKVGRGNLPRTDAALLQAASETAMLIQTAAAAAENAEPSTVAAAPEDEQPSATVTRARAAISAIDTLLEQAR